MNREHPTGTERKSLNYECGWKGGDRGGLAGRKKVVERKNVEKNKKLLTGIGLLMEGATEDLAKNVTSLQRRTIMRQSLFHIFAGNRLTC